MLTTTHLPGRMLVAATLMCCALVTACGKKEEKPIVTPSVSLEAGGIEPGALTPVHYRFAVANDAPPFSEDYLVFVHAVDAENFMLWADDHAPATPTSQWKPGAVIEYTREMFVPYGMAAGSIPLQIGLYSPKSGHRISMTGTSAGMHEYRVATLDLVTHGSRLPPLFYDGWNNVESEAAVSWRWTKGESTFALPNARADASLILIVDQPATSLGWPQQIAVRVGSTEVDRFTLTASGREIRRIPVPAAAMEDGDLTRITILTDKTFVPRTLPQLKNPDTRELGIRFFTAYFEKR